VLALRLGVGHSGTTDDGVAPDRLDAPRMARINADNFALFVEGASGRAAVEAEVRALLSRAGSAVHMDGQTLNVSFSAGLAFYPKHGDTAETLLKSAEMALGALRRQGEHDAIQCYTEQMKVDAMSRLSMESALREAIDKDQFVLVYQPKVDADRGCIVGGEALVRWHHPTEGVIGPVAFIPLLEEMGLIGHLGQWVLNQACDDLSRWRAAGVPVVPIAVNLSAVQFGRQDLLVSIRDTLDAHEVGANMIELEVTESALMRDTYATAEVLHGLHGLGLSLAVDDFGTGYSSLAYLKRFAVDTLKIDRSFVQDCDGGGGDPAIVRAIIAMARSLGMGLVAEGVETEAQARVLQAHGCPVMQGYLFARPMSEIDFRTALRDGLPGADRFRRAVE
jgi:EAL domain-containing protein (putative c-di-GMP-specific phosphodiesterase class I)